MRHSKIFKLFGAILLLSAFAAVGALIVKALWNAVIPQTTGFAVIGFWQALGLLTLGLTLSGGMLVPVMMLLHTLHPEHRRRRQELKRHWHNMSEEQRRAFLAARGFELDKKD